MGFWPISNKQYFSIKNWVWGVPVGRYGHGHQCGWGKLSDWLIKTQIYWFLVKTSSDDGVAVAWQGPVFVNLLARPLSKIRRHLLGVERVRNPSTNSLLLQPPACTPACPRNPRFQPSGQPAPQLAILASKHSEWKHRWCKVFLQGLEIIAEGWAQASAGARPPGPPNWIKINENKWKSTKTYESQWIWLWTTQGLPHDSQMGP